MSKSLGNGVDPLEVIDKFGADALRFSLATGNSPGNDMRYIEERVESSRNFANKLWNAARFILMNLKSDEVLLLEPDNFALEDKWILSKYNAVVRDVPKILKSMSWVWRFKNFTTLFGTFSAIGTLKSANPA